MALRIETFSNHSGGFVFFKAIGHPLTAPKITALLDRLRGRPGVALYDPDRAVLAFHDLFPLDGIFVEHLYVQEVEAVGERLLGLTAQPITDIAGNPPSVLLIPSFDGDKAQRQIAHLLAPETEVISLTGARLPDDFLTDRRNYLSRLNFATNFALLREEEGQHTRIVTVDYWSAYGAKAPRLWCCLFDRAGQRLVDWTETLPGANGSIVIDSRTVRERFGLGPFTGSLFMHVLGAAGHEIVKYALDTFGDDPRMLSCTHDANAWPSALYAGLPAPTAEEQVVLWVQNSHPVPIRKGAIGLNLMGDPNISWLQEEIPAFGCYPLDVSTLLPTARWPQQFEVQAGKHFVRPRYEIRNTKTDRSRIAHANVERVDLKPDPRLSDLGNLLGKGFLLLGPVLPTERYRTWLLPTPMSTAQDHLPIQAAIIDASGTEVIRHRFGNLARSDSEALDVSALLEREGVSLPSGRGHIEVSYDFLAGTCADGWLHGIFRYQDTVTGHAAETSFGSHVFNTALVYKNEPQSYSGRPPGLSTRLMLRLGQDPWDTLCVLIYAASTPWLPTSTTELQLHDAAGRQVAVRTVRIPCGGSHQFRYHETFSLEERAEAGREAYVVIRDTTCRLFGYHGCLNRQMAFSFDHMFGF